MGKENKVKLIKDNIVQPALAMIMRIKMMKPKIMKMMMMTVVLVAPHMFEQGRCLINLRGKNAQVHRMPMRGTQVKLGIHCIGTVGVSLHIR